MTLGIEDGMQIVTNVKIQAQGYTAGKITTEAAGSVEHMLLALRSGRFVVGRATSTHILDTRLAGTSDIDTEYRHPRREGTVTVRTTGKLAGCIYIYREDVPSSFVHDVVGQVVHGIELVKLAKDHDILIANVLPQRIDLLGLPLSKAREITIAEKISLTVDKEDGCP
jgi:UPF0288 family protein (methanogenesis marker protein 3)